MKIGIIGGGQLGRMVALAGIPLGHQFKIWTDSRDLATSSVAEEQVIGPFHDPGLVAQFCEGLDAVTYEWENVPVMLARDIADQVPYFFPNPSVLEIIQDRYEQKSFFQKLKIHTAPFMAIQSEQDLVEGMKKLKTKGVLKTCRMGYDGKGQFRLKSAKDATAAWQKLGSHPVVLEGFVNFEMEVSLVAVRSTRGEMKFYPLVENQHENGILRSTFAPARLPKARASRLQKEAEKIARTIMTKMNYVGVMTIEFFLDRGKLLINEMASRVHNSGHWTIEGAETSQFENHIRAGIGMPLGSTVLRQPTAMVNILGRFPDSQQVLKVEGAHLHLYGKAESPHRKIGHITVCGASAQDLKKKVKKLQSLLKTK